MTSEGETKLPKTENTKNWNNRVALSLVLFYSLGSPALYHRALYHRALYPKSIPIPIFIWLISLVAKAQWHISNPIARYYYNI